MSVERLELPIEGMTCASCAVRVEKKLNKLEGVAAAVNYATERASVEFDAGRRLARAARRRGRVGRLQGGASERGAAAVAADDPAAALRFRLLVSAALTLPVLLLAMIPALQFDGWQWLSLQLATPVVLWGGWPFHRAALVNARHGAATMDTLISIGTLAAWALVALRALLRRRGRPVDADGLRARARRGLGRRRDLPRGRLGRRRPDPDGPLLRGAREATRRRRPEGAARARREGRRRPRPRRRGAARPGRGAARRRPLRRPARREDRHRRRDRVGRVRRRHLAPDRRERAGRGRPRRRGDRRDRQRLGPARRPRHPRRRRHRRRPDRAARHRGAGGQGAGAAARRPRLRRLRPDRDRDRRRDARVLARHRLRPGVRLRGRRRRPDHRVPVRARAGDADGAPRRFRPRRAARRADQGARGARADAPRHHRRPRQDRHRHRGADAARRRRDAERRLADGEVLRLAGAVEDASEHPVARAVADAARAEVGVCPSSPGSATCPARASSASSTASR